MCQKFVSDKLKAPSTAEFGDYQNDYIALAKAKLALDEATMNDIRNPDGIWRIAGALDSENGFGAMIRSEYTCILDHDLADDTWRALAVDVQ